jgi:hypothetical protein
MRSTGLNKNDSSDDRIHDFTSGFRLFPEASM